MNMQKKIKAPINYLKMQATIPVCATFAPNYSRDEIANYTSTKP